MKTDLDHELQKLGREILAEFEPMTAEEVTGLRARPAPRLAEVRSLTATRPARRPMSRRVTLVGAAAASAVLVVGLGVATRGGDDPQPSVAGSPDTAAIASTPATEATAVPTPGQTTIPGIPPLGDLPDADLAWPPRLVMGDGFDSLMTDVYESGFDHVATGSITYHAPGGNVGVFYNEDEGAWADSQEEGVEVGRASILGLDTAVFGYTADALKDGTDPSDSTSNDAFISYRATVTFDGHVLGVSNEGSESHPMSLNDFVAAAESLRPTTPDAWTSLVTAMQPNLIGPDRRPTVVDTALTDVPIPDGFDVEALRASPAVSSLEGVMEEAGTAVLCAWVDEWSAATTGGDSAAADDAAAAVADVRSWPAFIAAGPYMMFRVADGIANGTLVVDQLDITPDNAGSMMECPGYPPFGEG